MLRALTIIPLLWACDGSSKTVALGASHLTLVEGERAPVRVFADNLDDFELPSVSGFELRKVQLSDGLGFEVEVGCNAASGSDTSREIIVLVGGRPATLVVEAIDDPNCLATPFVWDEALCTNDSCVQCESPPASSATQVRLVHLESRAICFFSDPKNQDSTRPLADEHLALSPDTQAFKKTASGGVIVGRDWLVGVFDLVYTARAGTVALSKPVARVEIGSGEDRIGIELPDPPPSVPELLRSTIPIRVHRIGNPPCAITSAKTMGTTTPPFNARLYHPDPSNQPLDYPSSRSLPCDASDHTELTLAVVPNATNEPSLSVDFTIGGMTRTLVVPIESRLADIDAFCGTERLACADIDGDDTLEIVLEGPVGINQNTCAAKLEQFRAPATISTTTLNLRQLVTVPRVGPGQRPAIYGVDDQNKIHELACSAATCSWKELANGAGAAAIAIRTTPTVGPADTWIGLNPTGPGLLYTDLMGASQAKALPLQGMSNFAPTALAALDPAGVGPQRLFVVGKTTDTNVFAAYILEINWATKSTTVLGSHLFFNVPPDGEVSVAVRSVPGRAMHALFLVTTTNAFESYLGELYQEVVGDPNLNFTPRALLPGFRSLASTPDAVLLGAPSGVVRSFAVVNDPMRVEDVLTVVADPFADQGPDYASTTASCFAKDNTYAGLLVVHRLAKPPPLGATALVRALRPDMAPPPMP